jgi:hypothetical protein
MNSGVAGIKEIEAREVAEAGRERASSAGWAGKLNPLGFEPI